LRNFLDGLYLLVVDANLQVNDFVNYTRHFSLETRMVKVLVDDRVRVASVKHLLIVVSNENMLFELFKTKTFFWILVQAGSNKLPQTCITVLPVRFFKVE